MAFKDVLLGVLTGAAEQTEEISLETALQSLHENQPDVWKRLTDDMVFASDKLKTVVKGKFAQAMVEGLGIAAQESINANPGPAGTSDTTAGGN